MPQVSNPHKKFQFSIFLYGMNPFLAQKVTMPDREVAAIEHGEGNYTVKTGGMIALGNVIVEKLFNANFADRLFYGWIKMVQDEFGGGGAPPDIYKQAMQIVHYATNGVTVLKTY